jgi:hypothetical protein
MKRPAFMHSRILILALILVSTLRADPASHRQAAGAMLDLFSGPDTLRAGFDTMLDPMLDGMRKNGAPEPALNDIKDAFHDWLEQEIVWDELKPELVEVYMGAFSEDELRELLEFYRTPLGQKTLKKLPALFAEGARIGQLYAKKKEAGLVSRIQKVVAQHTPASAKP